ncbi:MAG: DUF3343 domain-containing protein [Oscillospiraceae bacterium]|nr:DUF3343 domain-containing protein [Oscillospiraceae bacterium]
MTCFPQQIKGLMPERMIALNNHKMISNKGKATVVTFSSVTFANKAKAALERAGYQSEVMRTPGAIAGGCGYSVVTGAPLDKVSAVMDKNNIHYRSVTDKSGR